MRKFITLSLVNIIAMTLLITESASVQADSVMYTRIGDDMVVGDDGSSYMRIGDTVYGSDGSTYTQIGDLIIADTPDDNSDDNE